MKSHRIAAVLLFVAAAAGAQMRETVNVNLVEVPVTVADAGGNAVRGLTAANFELIDQGKKRDITSFDTIDLSVPDTSAIAPMNPAARRSFLLLFDLGFSSPNALQRAQNAARQFVEHSVRPRDLVGVGTIDVDRGFHLLAAFTTDRELIAAAIGNPLDFRGSDPLQIANQRSTFDVQEPLTEHFDIAKKGLSDGLGGLGKENQQAAAVEQRDASEIMKRSGSGAVRKRIEKQVDALGEMAKALRGVPGRKQVIFLSEGFDAAFLQGRDARSDPEQKKENDAVLSGELWSVDSDARYGSVTGLSTLDRMASYFRSSDVVLYAIDIKGVRVQNDVGQGATINSNAGLFALARPTGGLVFENSNDLKNNFARMLRAQEVVYVLGFQAPSAKPGSFHELKVRVVGAGAAHVSYRAGYFESGAETAAEKLLSDAEIIVNDIAQSDVRVGALAAAFPMDVARAQVPVVLEINGADLLQSAKDGNASAEVYIYAFDRAGIVRDRLFEKMRLDLAKAGDRLRTTGVKFIAALTLPPGEYAVKALVRIPDSGRRGFARADVKVPRPGEVAAATFFVDEQPPRWVLVRGTTLDVARYPFQMGGQPFVPSAAARLRRGETRRFAVMVAGMPVEDVKVEAAGAQVVAKGESGGLAELLYSFDPAGIAAGPAALRIKVAGQTCNLPFIVESNVQEEK